MHDISRSIKTGLFTLIAIILTGTFGYYFLEDGFSLFDSFYMTIITISTTGFKEVRDLSFSGRILTVLLIITGVTTIAYISGRVIQILIETQILRRRRMDKKLEAIGSHHIICGYGRMGKFICDDLVEHNVPFVVIENDPDKLELLAEKGFLFVNGDATKDEDLLRTGIQRAKGLVAVLNSDADNVFATLSARELNPSIYVVARANEEGTEPKLKKAGADRVVLPYELSGTRMVQLLVRPGVMDFIDGIAKSKDYHIGLEEIYVSENSPLLNIELISSPIRKELNIIIVAIYKNRGKLIYNPKSDTKIELGDKLIAIGETSNLNKLNELCGVHS